MHTLILITGHGMQSKFSTMSYQLKMCHTSIARATCEAHKIDPLLQTVSSLVNIDLGTVEQQVQWDRK